MCVRKWGVDNWNGYDYSLDEDEEENGEYSFRRMMNNKTDEEITKDYEDYEVN